MHSGPLGPWQRRVLAQQVPVGPQSAAGGRTTLRTRVLCSSPYSIGFLLALSPPCVSDCFPQSVDIFLYLPAYLYAIKIILIYFHLFQLKVFHLNL